MHTVNYLVICLNKKGPLVPFYFQAMLATMVKIERLLIYDSVA